MGWAISESTLSPTYVDEPWDLLTCEGCGLTLVDSRGEDAPPETWGVYFDSEGMEIAIHHRCVADWPSTLTKERPF